MSTDTLIRNSIMFERVARQIEEDPASYDQNTWGVEDPTTTACGTRACIAGWTVLLNHPSRVLYDAHKGIFGVYDYQWNDTENDYDYTVRTVQVAAREILGLTKDEATILFGSAWEPKDWLGVPMALRALGKGATIEDVTAA